MALKYTLDDPQLLNLERMMQKLIYKKYKQCEVGQSSFVSRSELESLSADEFQLTYETALEMQSEGLIDISCERNESSSGKRQIEIFKITRLQ